MAMEWNVFDERCLAQCLPGSMHTKSRIHCYGMKQYRHVWRRMGVCLSVFVCISMYMYICVCLCVCLVYVYVYVSLCVHTHISLCICLCMYVCVCLVYVCISVCACMCVSVCLSMYVCLGGIFICLLAWFPFFLFPLISFSCVCVHVWTRAHMCKGVCVCK